jgi:ABC-type lipoprotein release transport system permease subunit
MIGRVSAKYAVRSLRRHPRRTILSVLGVGIGCSIGLFAISWIKGAREMEIRAIAESGAGHLRVVPAGWLAKRENALRLANWQQTLALVKATPGVQAAAPRARSNGLLAMGNRTAGVEVIGVNPEAERACNRVVRKSTFHGRYLEPGDSGKVVIGKVLARRLDVQLDDDLQVTLSGREEMRSAMLRIVGIAESGGREIDASFCHVTLEDINRITGYEGPAEITILLENYKLTDQTQNLLARSLPGTNQVITWKEINPGFAAGIEGDRAFTNGLVGIVIIVVALGIASGQLTAVLERRREFAILVALGMKGVRVVGLIFLEALMIALGGAIVSLALGGPAAYYLADKGVNIAGLYGTGDISIGDVLLDPRIYGDFGLWVLWFALGVSLLATLIASIYPAWFATRTDPTNALRMV